MIRRRLCIRVFEDNERKYLDHIYCFSYNHLKGKLSGRREQDGGKGYDRERKNGHQDGYFV